MQTALEQLKEKLQELRMERDLQLNESKTSTALSTSKAESKPQLLKEHKRLQRLAGITNVSFEDLEIEE